MRMSDMQGAGGVMFDKDGSIPSNGECILCGEYIVRSGEAYIVDGFTVCNFCYKNKEDRIRYMGGVVNPTFPATAQSVELLLSDVVKSVKIQHLFIKHYKYIDGNISLVSPGEDNIPFTHCNVVDDNGNRLFAGTFDEVTYLLVGYWVSAEYFKIKIKDLAKLASSEVENLLLRFGGVDEIVS